MRIGTATMQLLMDYLYHISRIFPEIQEAFRTLTGQILFAKTNP
jgi:hypothetical protein